MKPRKYIESTTTTELLLFPPSLLSGKHLTRVFRLVDGGAGEAAIFVLFLGLWPGLDCRNACTRNPTTDKECRSEKKNQKTRELKG
jgi:hypothetical protein